LELLDDARNLDGVGDAVFRRDGGGGVQAEKTKEMRFQSVG
jgi:hypothetical protein